MRAVFSCVLALALPLLHGQSQPPPQNLDIYLLMGGANMAAVAGTLAADDKPLDRCFVLGEDGGWLPVTPRLGTAYGFARKLAEQTPGASIGLIVVTKDDSKLDDWLGKSEIYYRARRSIKVTSSQGRLKGVLWHHGENDAKDPAEYLEKLKSLVSNLRTDFNNTSLPFVAGQTHIGTVLSEQISLLPGAVHLTAVVPANGLITTDGILFETKSRLALGERYAEQILQLQKNLATFATKPPADLKFIDPHVHAMSVTPLGLRAVALWMEERNVERCIVSPLSHKGSRPQTEEERQTMLANFKPYKGRIDRMTIIDPGEMETVEEAVTFLKKEIADGAVGFGEHYGVGLMFDDPKNLMLYEACEKAGLPVMFHIDQNKNMVEPGMARVDRVLKMFPKCKLVAHAYWWRQLANGTCDRQLQEHPNLYADMSGHVVINVLNRDRKYAREFLIRNQDKILWATDEGWWSFSKKESQMNQHYTFFEELDLPADVRYKIYRGNAEKVYGLK